MSGDDLPGVLVKGVHETVYEAAEAFARAATIPEECIWRPLEDACGPYERAWVRGFWQHAAKGHGGLLYEGEVPKPSVLRRMQAMAGCLIRNFVDARVRTIADVIQDVRANDPPLFTCMLVPDFYEQGGGLARWQVAQLRSLLVQRQAHKVMTVVYVHDMDQMRAEYGLGIARHVERHYARVEKFV